MSQPGQRCRTPSHPATIVLRKIQKWNYKSPSSSITANSSQRAGIFWSERTGITRWLSPVLGTLRCHKKGTREARTDQETRLLSSYKVSVHHRGGLKNISLLKVLVNLSRSKKKMWPIHFMVVRNCCEYHDCIAFLIFCPLHSCRKDEMLCKDRCQIGNRTLEENTS